jgi:2,4-dienoyl-CoA reductase (NADPH2)
MKPKYLKFKPQFLGECSGIAKDLEHQVALSPINVRLNQTVDEALIEAEKPDAVILATSAVPITPPIPGVDLPQEVQAWDVLQGNVITGKRVVIIGGGAVGIETALFLAEKGTLSAEALKFLLKFRTPNASGLTAKYDW